MVKKALLTAISLLFTVSYSQAQCAMCKTTIVNNVNHGELSLAEGLNFGIIYLFVTPYLAIAVVAFFWYRSSKTNAAKKRIKSHF